METTVHGCKSLKTVVLETYKTQKSRGKTVGDVLAMQAADLSLPLQLDVKSGQGMVARIRNPALRADKRTPGWVSSYIPAETAQGPSKGSCPEKRGGDGEEHTVPSRQTPTCVSPCKHAHMCI